MISGQGGFIPKEKTPKQSVPSPAPSKKGVSPVCIIGGVCGGLTVIGLIIVLIFVFFVFRSCSLPLFTPSFNTNNTSEQDKAADEAIALQKNIQPLVGTWVSGCLSSVSTWGRYEKHQFTINSDGTVVHSVWHSNNTSCTITPPIENTHYKISITAAGQINFKDTEKGTTLYDIYKISGGSLYFGHGYRGSYAAATTAGDSAANRISSLNTYIAYRK